LRTVNSIETLSQVDARVILSSLADGVVPVGYARLYHSGRWGQVEKVRHFIRNARDGDQKVAFINGDYGSGKTQFLALLLDVLVQDDFAASLVVLSPRESPLSDLVRVHGKMMRVISPAGGDGLRPIERILNLIYSKYRTWLRSNPPEGRLSCPLTGLRLLFCDHCHVEGTVEAGYIPGFKDLDKYLQCAITLYRRAMEGKHPDKFTADMVVRWLEAEPLYRRHLNYLGLWDHITQSDALDGFQRISQLVRSIGYQGLIVMLDEAERIPNMGPRESRAAYHNLSLLIQESVGSQGLNFIYATTPTFFQDILQFAPEVDELITPESKIDLSPLTKHDLAEIGKYVMEIVARAHLRKLNDLQDGGAQEKLLTLIEEESRRNPEGTVNVRRYMQKIVSLLDAIARSG